MMRAALSALFALIIFATASAQPAVTLRGQLPGDAAVGAAAGTQQDHVVAAGGEMLLAVWSDYRSQTIGGGTNQSGGDLFAARLDAAGNPLDASPFLLAGGMGLQNRPRVAWNGSAWLVVFESQDPVGGYYGTRLRAVRVSGAGQVLDAVPLTLPAGSFTPDTVGFNVAGLNGQWLVTRCLYHDDGYGTYLSGQRIGGGGEFVDPAPVMLMDWVYGQTVALAAAGEFLVAGPDWNDGAATKARRITASGAPNGAAFNVPGLELASNGSEYYVVWLSNYTNLVGSRMTSAGTLLTPAGTPLVTGLASLADYDLTHDGTNWWLLWGASDVWRTLRISAAGALMDAGGGVTLPIVIGGNVNTAYSPALAPRPGGGVHMAWYDLRQALGNDTNVFLLPIAADNVPGSERCVSNGTRNQRESDLAEGPGGQVALVYVSEHANDDRVMFRLLDAAGHPATPAPIEVAAATVMGRARVAWNGAQYLVTWDQGGISPTPSSIRARRLDATGLPLADPFEVMPGFGPDVEALGADFLIAGARYGAYPQFIDTWMRIVDGATGGFRNAATLLGGGYVNVGPRVRSDGTRWIVTYHSHWSHDASQSDAVYNFVAHDGLFTPAANPATTSGSAGTPDVAFSGSVYLFVWRNNSLSNANNYIAGRIMNANGTFLTGNFTIAEAPGRQLLPTVGWDGTDFVVVWDDQRQQGSFYDERTDVYAARVSPTGVVRDPDGFVVHAGPQGDATASLLCRPDGVSHVAWSSLETDGAPLDTYRVHNAVLGQITLSGVDDEAPRAPVALRQNVPNPFNPTTTITFALAAPERASLEVYDVRGGLVRKLLVDVDLGAGLHAATWDGRDDRGLTVPAGVYLCSLRTPSLQESRAMVLAK